MVSVVVIVLEPALSLLVCCLLVWVLRRRRCRGARWKRFHPTALWLALLLLLVDRTNTLLLLLVEKGVRLVAPRVVAVVVVGWVQAVVVVQPVVVHNRNVSRVPVVRFGQKVHGGGDGLFVAGLPLPVASTTSSRTVRTVRCVPFAAAVVLLLQLWNNTSLAVALAVAIITFITTFMVMFMVMLVVAVVAASGPCLRRDPRSGKPSLPQKLYRPASARQRLAVQNVSCTNHEPSHAQTLVLWNQVTYAV